MNEQREKLEAFNKELKNIKKNQTEMKNTITKLKIYTRRNQQYIK